MFRFRFLLKQVNNILQTWKKTEICPFLKSASKDPLFQCAHVPATHLSRLPQVSGGIAAEQFVFEPMLLDVSDVTLTVVATIRKNMSSTTEPMYLPHLWTQAAESFSQKLKRLVVKSTQTPIHPSFPHSHAPPYREPRWTQDGETPDPAYSYYIQLTHLEEEVSSRSH